MEGNIDRHLKMRIFLTEEDMGNIKINNEIDGNIFVIRNNNVLPLKMFLKDGLVEARKIRIEERESYEVLISPNALQKIERGGKAESIKPTKTVKKVVITKELAF